MPNTPCVNPFSQLNSSLRVVSSTEIILKTIICCKKCIIQVKVQDIKIEGDHTAAICLENAAELHESGNNNFDAEIRFDQLPAARHLKKDSPITPRQNLNLPVKEMQGLDIGTKIASPRVDPSEGAGDTFTA